MSGSDTSGQEFFSSANKRNGGVRQTDFEINNKNDSKHNLKNIVSLYVTVIVIG